MGRITNYTADHDRLGGVEYLWKHDPTGDFILVSPWRPGYQMTGRRRYYIYHVAARHIPDDVASPSEINDHYQRIDDDYYTRKDEARKTAVSLMKHSPQGAVREIPFDLGVIRIWGTDNIVTHLKNRS